MNWITESIKKFQPFCHTQKTRAEDTSDKYQNSYAQRYAYSILLAATKLRTTDTICGIVQIGHLTSYSEAFVYNLIRIWISFFISMGRNAILSREFYYAKY